MYCVINIIYWDKSIPHRIAKIHVVNPHSTIEACMAFFRPLISKKLSDRQGTGRNSCSSLSCTPSVTGRFRMRLIRPQLRHNRRWKALCPRPDYPDFDIISAYDTAQLRFTVVSCAAIKPQFGGVELSCSISTFTPMPLTLIPKNISLEILVKHRVFEASNPKMWSKFVPRQLRPALIGKMFVSCAGLWQKKLIDYRDWFSVSSSLKSDESKRIGKCRFETSDSCFGNQGSFRKIEVD
ncbi:unnamed protein product [Nesidiocoris tenuis]|uniref:Uncharacterized protein n=1 Tax=Nesidiocoris tenuis TaxID=355587 RepID=A0A6H5H0I0_9HEMI|nr:unnamed protein product [Nesidiocoris tenuis]